VKAPRLHHPTPRSSQLRSRRPQYAILQRKGKISSCRRSLYSSLRVAPSLEAEVRPPGQHFRKLTTTTAHHDQELETATTVSDSSKDLTLYKFVAYSNITSCFRESFFAVCCSFCRVSSQIRSASVLTRTLIDRSLPTYGLRMAF
jgi:hypothetical protein